MRAASGYLLDPHTACGWVAAEDRATGLEGPKVILATAHPAKFPEAMERITGSRPGLPPRLKSLMTDPERTVRLQNDLAQVERFVEKMAGASARAPRESREGAA